MACIPLIFKIIAYCYLIFYAFTIYGGIVIKMKERNLEKIFKKTIKERTVGAILALGVLIL